MKFLVYKKRVSKSFRVLEEWFWIIKGAEHQYGFDRCFRGCQNHNVFSTLNNPNQHPILNLENLFFAVLREYGGLEQSLIQHGIFRRGKP